MSPGPDEVIAMQGTFATETRTRIAAMVAADPDIASLPLQLFTERVGCSPKMASRLIREHRAGGIKTVYQARPLRDRTEMIAFLATDEAWETPSDVIAARFKCRHEVVIQAWAKVHRKPKPRVTRKKPSAECGVPDRVAARRLSTFYRWRDRQRQMGNYSFLQLTPNS